MSWLEKFIPASRASLYVLGMTVVAVVAAWPINGERFTAQQVVGGLVVLGAAAAAVSRPAETAEVAAEPPTGTEVFSRT